MTAAAAATLVATGVPAREAELSVVELQLTRLLLKTKGFIIGIGQLETEAIIASLCGSADVDGILSTLLELDNCVFELKFKDG